ncbi:alpha/beta hydrolase [Pseudomonas alloputida]|uniref:alpha/beta hydrolase n=1 Tax=Pseudomonas TaxID=286 RepID=UPI003EF07D3C
MRRTSIPLDFPESDRVIYESENLVAIYCRAAEAQSRQLVVAFHALQLTHYLDLPRKGQSRETLRGAGLDTIQVIPRGNHWYQYDDIEPMIAEIRCISDRYSEVVAYGQSMGAYGAIHTSGLLRPSKVFAICPQFSIDPQKIKFDSGFKILAAGISFIRDDVKENTSQDSEFLIAYDQFYSIDCSHYREYERSLKKVFRMRMPFCGHGVSEALKAADMIPDYLLRLIIGGKDEVNETRKKFRTHRACVPAYVDALRLALTKRQLKNKNMVGGSYQALKLYESNKRFSSFQLFCEVAEQLSSPQQAAARWFFAISLFGVNAPSLAYVRAVKYSRLGGDVDLAKMKCRSALEKFPNDFGLMREYLDILIHDSDFSGAKMAAADLKRLHGSKADEVIRNRRLALSV